MSFKEIFEQLFADRGPIIAIFLIATTIIQIAPLKLNPWTALFRWIGNKLNTSVLDKIEEVEDKVDTIEGRLDSHIADSRVSEVRSRRQAILDFASSLIRGENFHKEKFEFMIAECDSYEKYCKDNNIINGVADTSIREIRRVHEERYRTNSFLPDQSPLASTSNKKKRTTKEVES